MKQDKTSKGSNIIATCLFFLTAFSFAGIYIVQSENEILRKELAAYENQEIRR